MTDAFAYAELDEILRAGRTGAIGMSAIDGLIAALVAAPSFVRPEEWIPLIFGGRQPLHENSPELHAVKTIFNRYNEVSETLADWPPAYRPIFMVDDDGSIIARDWAIGFALGIGLRSKEWGECILLTEHRQALVPILVYCEGELDLLPDMPAAEKRRREAEARRAAAQAAAYAKHLDQLATRTEAAWEKAAELIETRRPRDYDLAASLLRDLQALADRQEDPAAFRKRFGELRAQHQRKPSLLDRFDQAGLPS